MTRRYANLVTADLQAVHERVSLFINAAVTPVGSLAGRAVICLNGKQEDAGDPFNQVALEGALNNSMVCR